MSSYFQPTPDLSPGSEKAPQVQAGSSNETLVAVCGVALRAPGGIKNTADYWDLLVNGRDARGPIPPSRYNIDGFDDSLGGRGPIKTRFGYFLDDDLSQLDTSFFSMSRKEVERCDPQQRLLLEVTREALEDAGEVDYRGKRIACFVGTFGDDWAQIAGKETLHPQGGLGYVTTGHGDLMLSNRVSYEYDLKGPSMTVKTGCSASLIALHEACRAIADGDATGAIVGGTSLIMTPTITAAFFAEGILSPEGSCKSFDASADGFARAEAITAVYVKPLSAAVRDGNAVRAVIRATGSNSDGRGQGMMAPNGEAQEALMRKVYWDSGLDPAETAYVECHGTGTSTGDPIEVGAVGNIFGEKGVYIGSVKPNVGHSEGSSGLNSLIKCVLSLEHKVIPPNIKFVNPNPKIPFAEKGLKVPTAPTPFPEDRKERISINSFGIGGSNAHVILEAYHPTESSPVIANADYVSHGPGETSRPELLLLSANTAVSLKDQMHRIQEFVQSGSAPSVYDLAYTLNTRRERLPHRAFTLVKDQEVLETSGLAKIPAKPQDVYMIFSGQGAQWAGMAKECATHDPSFRRDINRMDEVLQQLENPPSWTILDELLKPAESSRVNTAELSQPLCTAVQVALFNKLQAAGIKPAAVVGHSSGEIAAAYATGAVSLEAAITAAYYRGFVTTRRRQQVEGAMAAVGMGWTQASEFLVDGVVVACENSPSSVTISGDKDKVLEVIDKIKAESPDTLARLLKVDMAYHSHHMTTLGQQYVDLLQREFARLRVPWKGFATATLVSSVMGHETDAAFEFGPEYWRDNLVSPVRFSTAVARLLETRADGVFMEIGPHSALAGPLRQICAHASRPCEYTSLLVRGQDALQTFSSALGRLFQQGVEVDFSSLYPGGGKVLNGLPTYAWDHTAGPLWYESRISRAWRTRRYAHHALLGARVPESPDTAPQWRNVLYLEDEPWIADHKVKDDVVFPFAGYVAMAGEAVRQMTGVDAGYNMRHVVAHAAIVLTHDKGVELITTLRRHALTDSDVSEWFEFSISSYNGATWTKHAEGQVMAVEGDRQSGLVVRQELPRKVNISRFYDYMEEVGIVFGPEFRRLENVTSSTTEARATADISPVPSEQGRAYVMHPAAIDACFQLCLLSQARGLGRYFDRLVMPTLIESLEVRRAGDKMTAAAFGGFGDKKPGVECASNGKLALSLSGFELTPLEEGDEEPGYDRYAAARLEWLPDFDFVDVAPLFKAPPTNRENLRLIEQLTLLCIIDSEERLRGLEPAEPHFEKLRAFLGREIQGAREGLNRLAPDSAGYLNLSQADRRAMIAELYAILSGKARAGLTEGLKRISDNIDQIFTGQADTIDILMEGGVLAELYNAMSFGYSDFVRLLSSTKPTLRILEVGAGTGGTTELILRDLMHEGGLPRYSTYTFTDVSAGFFAQARERFSYAPNMDYKVFDISRDPLQQDFTEGYYDVIFAANVVHATPCLKDTLANLNKVLRPGGALVLTEICTELRSPTYIFGNFVGWWLGEDDGRPFAPYVPPSRWDDELRASGFTGVETAVYDEEEPYMCCTTIFSRRPAEVKPRGAGVSLLVLDPAGEVATGLKSALEEAKYDVNIIKMGDTLPQDRDILSTVDIETNFFDDIKEPEFLQFRELIRTQGPDQKLLWLTSPVQIKCEDPRSAQALGAARTVRTELATPFHTLEISRGEPKFSELVTKVFNKIRTEEDDDNLVSDKEFVVDDGTICIGRYHPFSLADETAHKSLEGRDTIKSLRIGKPGDIESLHWVEVASPASIPAGQVEIEPRAIGLNLRDVLIAMGVIPHTELGFDVAGVITRVGRDITEFQPGDRVFAFCPDGCFGTRALLNRYHVAPIPDGLDFEGAASVPVVFATTIHGLVNIARVQRGQSVLVHAACGGLGLSAIQVCRMLGAEVYATCGSQDKVDFLVSSQKIPRDHIFYSRDESFVGGIMAATNGRGCDVVVNSLSGSLLHASWRCVAEFGTMLEVGKRDMLGHGKLDLNPFLGNRRFVCFEGVEMARKRPQEFGRMLHQFNEFYGKGMLGPIQQVTRYKSAEVVAAFRHLQHGSHIGKVVVSMTGAEGQIQAKPSARPVEFDPEAAYLLTGGLGGLGKSMSTWMIERGARCLVLLSRSAGVSEESRQAVRELESMGAEVHAVAGGAENLADVERAVRVCGNKPIRGVVHLAMVLRDSPMAEMTWAQWDEVKRPKIDGAWNLHNSLMTQKQPLDFFFLASSIVTVVDQPGQGNYSAASTYVEAFAQYRRGLGLPASVLNICPVKGVGFVADNPHAMRNTRAQGIYFLGEREFLDFAEHAVLNNRPDQDSTRELGPSAQPPRAWKTDGQVVMGLRSALHLEDPNNRCNWRRDRRMGSYHNIRAGGQADPSATKDNSGALRGLLEKAAEEPEVLTTKENIELLAHEIGVKVYDFMLRPGESVDTSLSLRQIGLDSLMATELRRWFRQLFGLQVSVLEIMGTGSLAQLGELVAVALGNKYAGAA